MMMMMMMMMVSWRGDRRGRHRSAGVDQCREQATGSVHRAAAVPLLLRRIVHHLLRPQDHQELRQRQAGSRPSAGHRGDPEATAESRASRGWTAARRGRAWRSWETTAERQQGRSGTTTGYVRTHLHGVS